MSSSEIQYTHTFRQEDLDMATQYSSNSNVSRLSVSRCRVCLYAAAALAAVLGLRILP